MSLINDIDLPDFAMQNTTTSNGLILAPNGNLVGVIPGSQADVGGSGITNNGLPSLAQLQAQQNNPTSGLAAGANSTYSAPTNILQKGAQLFGLSGTSGISLEDIVFVLLGLLLIAAGVFAFKSSQTIIQTAGKYASKASEVAA
jgi:hypothetical protein